VLDQNRLLGTLPLIGAIKAGELPVPIQAPAEHDDGLEDLIDTEYARIHSDPTAWNPPPIEDA